MTTINRERLILLFACFTAIFQQIPVDLYVPAMPVMTHAFNTSTSAVRLSMACYLGGTGSLLLVYGPLSDHVGRRPLAIFGFTLFTLASIGCVLTDSIILFNTFRFIQGMAVGSCSILYRTLLTDTFKGSKLAKNFSYVSIVWFLSPLIAPMIGGYIQHYFGWRMCFNVILVMGIVGSISVLLFMPETNQSRFSGKLRLSSVVSSYGHVLKQGNFWVLSSVIVPAAAVVFIIFAITPFLFQKQLGMSVVHFGWLSCGMGVIAMSTNLLNSRLVDIIPLNKLIRFGGFLLLLGSTFLLVPALFHHLTYTMVILPLILIIMSESFVFPNVMTTIMSLAPRSAGSVGAMQATVQMLGMTVFTVLASIVSAKTQLSMALIFFAMGIWVVGIFYVRQAMINRNRHEKHAKA